MHSCPENYCSNVRCEDCIEDDYVDEFWHGDGEHCCQRCIEDYCEDCNGYHIKPLCDLGPLSCSIMFPWATRKRLYSEAYWKELELLGRGINVRYQDNNDFQDNNDSDSDYDPMCNVCDEYYWTD